VRVHITELDIEVLPRTVACTAPTGRTPPPGADPANDRGRPAWRGAAAARESYARIFAVPKYADAIDRVTFWGVTDADSGSMNGPSPGAPASLLFDRAGRPKAAFDAVVTTASDP
jgi:endo-1,4-beta-xylanase